MAVAITAAVLEWSTGGAKFERVETMGEHRTGRPRCPRCDGEQVVQVPAPFVAMTGKKS